ncbi:MAG: hypothetical protein JOZ66_02125 [Hyphomicrobiales bacterium]|nr:hypothetical protein [Hyphomicrobiales bacterium]
MNATPKRASLLREVESHGFRKADREAVEPSPLPDKLPIDIGKGVSDAGSQFLNTLSFLGEAITGAAVLTRWPRHFRAPAFVHQMELIAFRGVPIIVLISYVAGGLSRNKAGETYAGAFILGQNIEMELEPQRQAISFRTNSPKAI